MVRAIDPGTGRRTDRAEPRRVRTVPPGLLLVGGGPASDGADLIALARAARRDAGERKAGAAAEQI